MLDIVVLALLTLLVLATLPVWTYSREWAYKRARVAVVPLLLFVGAWYIAPLIGA